MAGIKSALKRVMDGKNVGIIVAMGVLGEGVKCDCAVCQVTKKRDNSCDFCRGAKYIIIRLEDDGLITQYDQRSDLRINQGVCVGNRVQLNILDNQTAEWQLANQKKIRPHEDFEFEELVEVEPDDAIEIVTAIHEKYREDGDLEDAIESLDARFTRSPNVMVTMEDIPDGTFLFGTPKETMTKVMDPKTFKPKGVLALQAHSYLHGKEGLTYRVPVYVFSN